MTDAAHIIFLIDLQNGFAEQRLSRTEGGSLYVPEGEKAGEAAADLIRHARNTIFVLSQDYHPEDHISFFDNHPGLSAPFGNIFLRKDDEGKYRAIGVQDHDVIRAVNTNKDGYITSIRDETVSAYGAVKQTTWLPHCIQGTRSALFVDPLMAVLPSALTDELKKRAGAPEDAVRDERGNSFYVVRKGVRADLDSYGIATENNHISKTSAPAVFERIAHDLAAQGVSAARIGIGGLATNFCVEFSNSDIHHDFVPALAAAGIRSEVSLLTDMTRGIPVASAGGVWPDLDNAIGRMERLGTTAATTEDFIRRAVFPRPQPLKAQLKT